MINAECKEGMVKLTAMGSLAELCADLCCIVHAVYDSVAESDKSVAETFGREFLESVNMVFDNGAPATKSEKDTRLADLVAGLTEKINELKVSMDEDQHI